MTISQRMFKLMDDKRLTQRELSKKLDIAQSTISSWKNNNTSPPPEMLISISEFLGVTVEYLLSGRESDNVETVTACVEKQHDIFNNELVWKTYMKLTEKEKLEVQVFILGKGEAHEE